MRLFQGEALLAAQKITSKSPMPMKNTHKTASIAASSLLFIPLLSLGQLMQHWDFNDDQGTLASDAAFSIQGGPQFTTDIGSTVTTGDGALRIRRGAGESSNGQAFLSETGPQHLQIDLTIRGWNLNGTASEQFRVGFTHAEGVLQTADFNLVRTGDNEISMRASAFGGSGSEAGTLTVIPGLGNVRTDPVHVRLIYDGNNNQYQTMYDIGDGWVPLLIGGNSVYGTSSDRYAGALRIYALNAFNTDLDGVTEYFDISSITLTAIPEPSTYALLLGVGFSLFAILRRRRA